jgi:autotransporter-associated beta strand protein
LISASTNTGVIGNSSTTNNATLTFAGGTSNYAGVIQDALGAGTQKTALTVSSGSLTLSNVSSYSGNTNIAAGATLAVGSTGGLSAATNVIANGALQMGQPSQTIASLNGASTGSLVLDGATLTISNGGTFAGAWNDGAAPSTITAAGGTLTLNGATALTGTVIANAPVNFGGTTGTTTVTRRLTALNIADGVTATITHSTFPFTPTVLKTTSLAFIGGAKLDITNNAVIATGTAAAALGQIQAGQIMTSEPADPNKALGYIDLGGADIGKFEVRYTLKGDADLDGAVGVGDLGALATSYNGVGSWANGDFDRSGTVGVGDLGALATNYGTQLGTGPAAEGAATPMAELAGASSAAAAVPEPSAIGLLALGAASLATRRRRRQLDRPSQA